MRCKEHIGESLLKKETICTRCGTKVKRVCVNIPNGIEIKWIKVLSDTKNKE